MVTLELSEAEFATMVDCTPGIYNKLPLHLQRLMSELRDTSLYFEFEDKAVAAAHEAFHNLAETAEVTEPTRACRRFGHWPNKTTRRCNRCAVEC